jgi:hypothetical protein
MDRRSRWTESRLKSNHQAPKNLSKMTSVVDLSANVSFTFDSGPNTQKGLVWQLGQELTVNGYVIRLISATWQDDGNSNNTHLEFETDSADLAVIELDTEDLLYRSAHIDHHLHPPARPCPLASDLAAIISI